MPGLATTLRRIAAEGAGAVYDGSLAARAAAYLASRGAPIEAHDLAAHTSDWTTPIRTSYRGIEATSHPPNSCGTIALELLNVLGTLAPPPPEAFDAHGVADAAWVHLGLEAARATLAERDRWLTDPDAMAPGSARSAALDRTGRQHRRRHRPRLTPDRRPRCAARPVAARPTWPPPTAGAAWSASSSPTRTASAPGWSTRRPASATRTVARRSASIRPTSTSLAPRKRTMHTLTPGMLFRDGRPWVVHGSMGGEIQPQIFAQVVSALVDGGLDVATAVAAPRWAAEMPEHHTPPSLSVIESRYHPQVVEGLRSRGHDVLQRARLRPGAGARPCHRAAARRRRRRADGLRRGHGSTKRGLAGRLVTWPSVDRRAIYSATAGRAALTTSAAGHLRPCRSSPPPTPEEPHP